jgi:hypothetical protein
MPRRRLQKSKPAEGKFPISFLTADDQDDHQKDDPALVSLIGEDPF